MSFNWLQYLAWAQQLAGKAQIYATRESSLHSTISRAYYAAFILARNYLRDEESISIPEKQSHKFVIEQFKNSSEEVRQKNDLVATKQITIVISSAYQKKLELRSS